MDEQRWSAQGAEAFVSRPSTPLNFQHTVPRRLVHRAAVAEVFVTDALVLGEDRFLLGAQWPRDHALYHPGADGGSDPLLFAETIRQAMVFLAHWHYGIPLDHRFVGHGISFEITDPDALRVGVTPPAVTLEARWRWNDRRPPRRYGFEVEFDLSIDGRRCGSGRLPVVALDERGYRILRGRIGGPGARHAAHPAARPGAQRIAPELVGRLRAKDSVLSPGRFPDEWLLHADTEHAILFDHATDHVPLMVLLEGFRQLGHLLVHDGANLLPDRSAGHRLVAVNVECLSFVELDCPTRLVVGPMADRTDVLGGRSDRRFCITAFQENTAVARCTMLWAPTDAEPLAGGELRAEPCAFGTFDFAEAGRR